MVQMVEDLRKVLPNFKKGIIPLLLACLQTKNDGKILSLLRGIFSYPYFISFPQLEIICLYSLVTYWNIKN